MLSLKQVNDVCCLYRGAEQCRYLEADENNHSIFYCRKRSIDAQHINYLVNELIKFEKDKGNDPSLGSTPIGDNCPGYLPFKSVLQGYDIE